MPFDHDTMLKILRERTDWNITERIGYMKMCEYELPDIDNYCCEPMADLPFEQLQHRWLWLFQMTTGIERAAAIQLAVELFKATSKPHLYGVPFFSHAFDDATRDAYYAKAMCMLYRDLSDK
jgi:hypothetical protein